MRTGLLAAELFKLDLPQSDKRLFTFVETDGCYADGLSVATGFWLGRRTLRLVDYGKVASTLVDTYTAKAFRITPHPAARDRAFLWLQVPRDRWHARLDAYRTMPAGDLLSVQPVRLTVSLENIVSRPGLRVVCAVCGEEVMNGAKSHATASLSAAIVPVEHYFSTELIVISAYDPEWAIQYDREQLAIMQALGPYVAQIEHVGSTSVPGLAAKPIIDIGIDLNTYPLPHEAIEAMEALGYTHRGELGIPGSHYFVKGTPRTHHVHSYSPGNPEWEAHVLFRDYLRAHPEAARQYEQLKRDLAARHTDVNAYAEDKTDFVKATLARAREWRRDTSTGSHE